MGAPEKNGSSSIRFSSAAADLPGSSGFSANGRIRDISAVDFGSRFTGDRHLPSYTSRFFIDSDPSRGLDLASGLMADVDRYINTQIADFIVVPSKYSKEQILDAPGLMKDERGIYYLPFRFIRPNKERFTMRFNWDGEQNQEAVLFSDLPDAVRIAQDDLRNAALFLFPRKGYVPNAAADGYDDRTQPPRHTTMINNINHVMTDEQKVTPENMEFFDQMWQFAAKEYWTVFHPLDPENPNFDPSNPVDILNQNVYVNGERFIRYGGRDMAYHLTSELATGNDFTDRFYGRAADFQPIDLMYYLAVYERDFRDRARALGDEETAQKWEGRLQNTVDRMKKYHLKDGWFYDYDFKHDKKSGIDALVGFLPFEFIDDPELKQNMLQKLREDFVYPFGLVLTSEATVPQLPTDEVLEQFPEGMRESIKWLYRTKQWGYPNQFFNMTEQVVDVLMRAGEYDTAEDIMERTLIGLAHYFEEHGQLPEKNKATTNGFGNGAEYGDQSELAMPMGVFKKFRLQLDSIYERKFKGRHTKLTQTEEQYRLSDDAPVAQQ